MRFDLWACPQVQEGLEPAGRRKKVSEHLVVIFTGRVHLTQHCDSKEHRGYIINMMIIFNTIIMS